MLIHLGSYLEFVHLSDLQSPSFTILHVASTPQTSARYTGLTTTPGESRVESRAGTKTSKHQDLVDNNQQTFAKYVYI